MNKLITIICFFLISISCRSQELKNDSIKTDSINITFTENQIKAINTILVEYDFLKKEINLKDSLIKADSVLISKQDEQLTIKQERINCINNLNKELEKRIKKQSNKTKWITGIASILGVGLLVGLIVK